MHTSCVKIILSVLCVVMTLLFPLNAAPAGPMIFAVHPYLPATEIIEKFGPLARYLSKELGRQVIIDISLDYQNHIERTGRDNIDIAYMGPASYVKMVGEYGRKTILARQAINGKPTFQGVIIVRKESPLHALKDLAGKRFAFGDPESTMSHLVPRYMLLKGGVTIDRLGGHAFLENHHNVALGVLAGDFHAGAVKEEVFDAYDERGLRELARTPYIPDHVFVATKRVSAEEGRNVRDALYLLMKNEEGRKILDAVKTSMGLVPGEDSDYDDLREMLLALERAGAYK
ncbi:MAG: phosphate/phosphite/phosphonate ABC transporter substrate-binding protein [Nitrospiraceae bacterium]|nr:MAG: phosphate/phosphite/phosphonate ABC transporter substrate-binding protein [Nitrospiraceae bacterium]